MNLGLFGDKIYRSRVNYTEIEGSYEYTDRFHLTSMKTELLSMVGPFFHLEPNQNNALSEKQFLNKALHRLGIGGQCHSVCDIHGVFKARVHVPVFIPDRRW